MKNFNIVKIDTKGRLLIPYHIREYLNLDEGSEFIIINSHNGELKVLPLVKGKTAEISIVLDDTPGSLAKVSAALAKLGIDIMMSQSRVIERGQIAEASMLVDISNCKNFDKISNHLSHIKVVKKFNVKER